jgi:hypothetical protein
MKPLNNLEKQESKQYQTIMDSINGGGIANPCDTLNSLNYLIEFLMTSFVALEAAYADGNRLMNVDTFTGLYQIMRIINHDLSILSKLNLKVEL